MISEKRLVEVVDAACRKEYLLHEDMLTPAVRPAVKLHSTEGKCTSLADAPLTQREIEILSSIAAGNCNKQIASQLKISDQTVKNHITSILKKLEVADVSFSLLLYAYLAVTGYQR